MKRTYYKNTFWGELIGLLAIVFVFILPLGLGLRPLGLTAATSVDIYYVCSMLVLVSAQIGYIWPIKTLRIIDYRYYVGGMCVFALAVLFWFRRTQGRTIDFSNLESGNVWRPVVFALVLPFIHLFVHVAGTDNDKSQREG